MANKKPLVVNPRTGPTPSSGSLASPVNGNFAGPNAMGVLNDLPPVVQSGLDFAPFIAINGTDQNKLGIQGGASPKTHG